MSYAIELPATQVSEMNNKFIEERSKFFQYQRVINIWEGAYEMALHKSVNGKILAFNMTLQQCLELDGNLPIRIGNNISTQTCINYNVEDVVQDMYLTFNQKVRLRFRENVLQIVQ